MASILWLKSHYFTSDQYLDNFEMNNSLLYRTTKYVKITFSSYEVILNPYRKYIIKMNFLNLGYLNQYRR